MADLTKNEEILLLSVWRLKGEAYGVAVKKFIRNTIGKDWNYGTLYCTFDQLVKKGMLEKREGMPLPERGGRRKMYYSVTPEGIRTLQEAIELHSSLWDGVTRISLEKGMS